MTPVLSCALPGEFLPEPIANSALYDAVRNRPENVRAALTAGYGIEFDL